MTRLPWVFKLLAIGFTVLLLSIALMRIDFLVAERQGHQMQAIESVQQSQAGAQTVLGPVLQRLCVETWEVSAGEGKDRRTELRRHEHALRSTPAQLRVDATTRNDPRYRGLFKVNGYVAKLEMLANWSTLEALRPRRERVGSTMHCEPTRLWLSTSDVRGLRGASASVDGKALAVMPGTTADTSAQGLHALLVDGFDAAGSVPESGSTGPGSSGPSGLSVQLSVDLLGTQELSLVPAADATQWRLSSDWPHPSFGGRFLPNERKVGHDGFESLWSLNALATSAPRDVAQAAAAVCDARQGVRAPRCLDTLSVAFVDPVNPYSLSDRAIKYGLLFVLLTFTAVALAEALARDHVRRVHPVQYALVGSALCLFFLLLLSLSEHLAFGVAYLVASSACVVLLGIYARSMLGSPRGGALFGSGMALLYGLLYLLLLREQTALVIGSIGLFVALAAVMLLTRRVDWYGLARPAVGRGALGSQSPAQG